MRCHALPLPLRCSIRGLCRKKRDDKVLELAVRPAASTLVRTSMARTLAGLGQLKVWGMPHMEGSTCSGALTQQSDCMWHVPTRHIQSSESCDAAALYRACRCQVGTAHMWHTHQNTLETFCMHARQVDAPCVKCCCPML